MITRQSVEQRLAQLQAERDHLRVQLHAYDGAIQDCEYWLRVLDGVTEAAERAQEEEATGEEGEPA